MEKRYLTEEHKKKISLSKKGKKLTDEHRRKISLAKKGKKLTETHKQKLHNKRKSHVVTAEARSKISSGLLQGYASGRIKPPWKDKHFSELHKDKLRIAAIKSHTMGEKRLHSEATKEKIRQATIRQNTTNPKFYKDGCSYNTKPELKVEQELRKQDISYYKQYLLCGITRVDFFLPDYNVALFVDGDYWHCNLHTFEINYLYTHKRNVAKTIIKDMQINDALQYNGYAVIRLWESEINKDVSSILLKKLKEEGIDIWLHLKKEG